MRNAHLTQNDPTNQPRWLTIFRIALGLVILWKGISFFRNSTALETLIRSGSIDMFDNNAETLSFIITYANLLGGFFIAVGLFTRWACIVQIPIMVGAVIFIYNNAGMSFTNAEFVLSILVLIFLVVFAIKGSGLLSADEYFRNYSKAAIEPGHTKQLLG